jgi:hypothetical protein
MRRDYYREPNTKYGRPKIKIDARPPDFPNCDTKCWDGRRFLRELVILQRAHEWEQQRDEWENQPPFIRGTPIVDPEETDKFLCRPRSVAQIQSSEDAAHALALGMVLIAVDPSTPNLITRLNKEAKAIREKHPLPIKKPRGRPSEPADVPGIDAATIEQWRVHRIITLHELRLAGHHLERTENNLLRGCTLK